VVERDLEILNPTSHEKLMLLADYCSLGEGDRVLEVGSGKGYMLRRWAERFGIEGTGVEINSSFVAQARSRASAEGVGEGVGEAVTFVEGDARDFVADPEGYDMVACIGAPFAIGSFGEAVGWMLGALKSSGVLAIGDVFLRAPLPEGAAEREGFAQGDLRTLEESAAVLEGHGLAIDGLIAASEEDWDRYASASWRAARAWAAANPEDPDRVDILSMTDGFRRRHLRFTRRYLGWAMFVARRAVEESGG
jgi:cyclopropane fatty-acyl-phospholipid synthase-like methyltransferase